MEEGHTGEKTEEPTPKKLKDAKKKGDVAQSKESSSIAIFIMFGVMSIWLIPNIYHSISELLTFTIFSIADRSILSAGQPIEATLVAVAKILIPPLVTVFLVVMAVKILEVGGVFSGHPMKIDFSKLAFKGFKSVFSKKNLFDWCVSICKTLLIGFIIFSVIFAHIDTVVRAGTCDLDCIFALWGRIGGLIILFVAIAGILIAAFDISMQRMFHRKKHKMSIYDVKKEFKETQGNPEIIGKRRELHEEIMNSPVRRNVENSTVIIANPTHVAIGLQYTLGQDTLPIVTLMEIDNNALLSRKIAYFNRIPVFEDPPLARALLAKAQVNDYIPEEFIDPVVVVMKWALGLNAEKTEEKTEEETEAELEVAAEGEAADAEGESREPINQADDTHDGSGDLETNNLEENAAPFISRNGRMLR